MTRRFLAFLGLSTLLLTYPGLAKGADSFDHSLGGGRSLTLTHVGGTNTSGLDGFYLRSSASFRETQGVFFHPERLQGGDLLFTFNSPEDGSRMIISTADGREIVDMPAGESFDLAPGEYNVEVRDSFGRTAGSLEVRQLPKDDPRYTAEGLKRLEEEKAAHRSAARAREGGGGLVPCDLCTIEDLVRLGVNIFNWLLAVGGAAALLAVIVAGIRYLIAVLQGADSSAIQAAKQSLTYAIIGLVVLLTAVVIVRTVTATLGLSREGLPPGAGEVGDILP